MTSKPSSSGQFPRLGTLEARVMDVLWDHDEATIRGLIDHLPERPAYTTIATVLTNLDKKQLVRSSRRGRSTYYEARVTRHEYEATLIGHVLDSSPDRSASILRFVESMPDSDLSLLRSYLDRRDEQEQP